MDQRKKERKKLLKHKQEGGDYNLPSSLSSGLSQFEDLRTAAVPT